MTQTEEERKEKRRIYNLEYREKNRDKINAQKREYAILHPEQHRNYVNLHKEHIKECARKYYKQSRIGLPIKVFMTKEERKLSKEESNRKWIKENYEKHKENCRINSMRYKNAHREECRIKDNENHKRYWREDRNNIRERNRIYSKKGSQKYKAIHPERIKETKRKYRKNNPDKGREYSNRRRANKLSALGRGITAAQERELFEEYNYHCSYCGCGDKPLEIDHIEPLSKGGSNDIENATVACRSCNSSKHDKTLLRFLYNRHQKELAVL